MEYKKKSNVTSGIFLILLGLLFLAYQIIPNLSQWLALDFTWPLILVGIAGILLVIGLFTRTPEMAIPACILSSIGGILYFQNAGIITWESWSYIWALIPGFAGVGTIIAGLFRRKSKMILEGVKTLVVSFVLFAIFTSIFGNMFGHFPLHGAVLPLILIFIGIFALIRALIGKQ